MEPPATLDADSLHDEQAKVFRAIKPMKPENVVRGQFKGYRDEDGVKPDSQVETYAAVRFEIDSWRWYGVPWVIRAGKSLPTTQERSDCDIKATGVRAHGRQTQFRALPFEPEISITIGAQAKASGQGRGHHAGRIGGGRPHGGDEMGGYERLLGDAMEGDHTALVRRHGGFAVGRLSNRFWITSHPCIEYEPGTWGPSEATRLVADLGGWQVISKA